MTSQLQTTKSSGIEPSAEALEREVLEARNKLAWERDRAQIDDFFNHPLKYISAFWEEYKPIVYTVATLAIALFAVRIVFGVVHFITGLPLIGSLIELVGIGYSVWFANRYLLKAETRQELSRKIDELKQDVAGATEAIVQETIGPQDGDQA